MENRSISTKNNNSTNIETHVSIDFFEIERTLAYERTKRPILHRVQPHLREKKNHIYNPVAFSLGPYHHNKSPNSKFHRVEEFKNEVLNTTLDPTAQGVFRGKILERVDEIRIFYEGVSIDEYKDEELAEMMLRDTCFVLYYMEMVSTGNIEKRAKFLRWLGMSIAVVLYHDTFLLENQIPLWVLNLLISMKFDDKDEGKAFLCKFLSFLKFADYRLPRVPWDEKDQEPLHLLEAHRRIAVTGEISSTSELQQRILECHWRWRKSSQIKIFELINSPFRSVTDLKRKGIHFGPSSYCLIDVRFNSYWFHGKLQLPIAYINNNSQVFFSNAIALEMSPENYIDFSIRSYVNFMKSLIESPKDVKELRESGILFSSFGNDEEVVKVFKKIDTYGVINTDIFQEINMRINEHCKSKGKTWMAELIHSKFRTPWTAIALLAAIFLLCLTFLQTYYTINPR